MFYKNVSGISQLMSCTRYFYLIKASNVYGWPQLVVSVYGMDYFGRDVVYGYGCMRLPLHNGTYILLILDLQNIYQW